MDTDEIEAAAHELAGKLRESENMIQAGLANMGAMVFEMHRISQAAGLTIFHGQDLVRQTVDLMGILVDAREKVASLHQKLDKTQRLIGLNVAAFGWVGKPPADATPLMRDVPPQLT